ncbi:unnamed protein product [Rotaria sordida]|uniref:Major facilitator superfamily associated domain-containing protein n=1 Tax=Rotaria sordida TaxID=392033 RepID=A0A819IPT5_9BILA|nr:unnamed protein product [Rotaria sordida]
MLKPKPHYFLTYSSFAAIGPILNITLRNRGLSDIEISCINLINPFLIFFTNPLLAFFADHIRRFRLTFNIILCLITIVFSIIFFLPTLKSYSIQGEIYQIDTMKYSLTFCANKEFSTKCALRTRCGCTYQAYCRLLTMEKIYFNKSIPIKTFHFNFTMNSTYVDKQYKNVSIRSNKLRICSAINYHVSIDKDTNDEIRDLFDNSSALSSSEYFKLATCDIKCSIDHLCHGSRYSHQILYLLLYSFLMIIGLNLFALATTLGTTIAFSTLHHSNLFGRQRAWGTIGSGISAFFVSRLYVHFKTKYYLMLYIDEIDPCKSHSIAGYILQGIVYGRGIGMLISLFIYTRMKKRHLFLIYAVFNIANAIIYSVYYLLIKRRKSFRIDCDDIPESVSIESGKLVLENK